MSEQREDQGHSFPEFLSRSGLQGKGCEGTLCRMHCSLQKAPA